MFVILQLDELGSEADVGTACFVTDINGTLVPREDRWLLALQYAPDRGEKPGDFAQVRTEELVRKAAGLDNLRVKLFDARPWEVSAWIADRFASRRVFMVGDAAHSMPPTGGFGGNTGIHDAHNLAYRHVRRSARTECATRIAGTPCGGSLHRGGSSRA